MYESGGSNCFEEIGSFDELKYTPSSDDEPSRKKRCGLTVFSGLSKEQVQSCSSFERLEQSATTTLVLTSNEESEHGHLKVSVSPAEEVLGSVTTFYPAGHPENGHTLRTSARVKHKMRMETIHNNPLPADRKDQPKANSVALVKTPTQQKQMRVVWSNHDKNLFFEALNEYGKDFEAILNYLNTKKRRKDNACEQQVFKTKDVRNLFYQFNQKISKYLQFSDEVKKEAQELYALINYGEMRKKVPFQNKKYFYKLKDLVYKGFTMVREKGKTIRIKTPSCRALRKLNQLEEWQEEIRLPPRVDVILQPANMDAWGRVQSLAQNPRVRITATIQKRVSALLQLFQQKWRPQDLRLTERVEKMKTASTSVTSKLTRQRMQNEIQFCSQLIAPSPSQTSTDVVGQVLNLQLHFVPSHSAVIHRALISLAEFQSNTSICLNSYEQRIGVKVRGETLALTEKPAGGTCKKPKLCHEVGLDATKDEKQVLEQITKINIIEFLKSPNASNESIEWKELDSLDNELTNGHGARSSDDCDGSSALDPTNSTVGANTLVALGPDLTVAPMSDNSNDEFVLLNERIPMKYETEMMAEHMAMEKETIRDESVLNSCETTLITTTVRKKCTRRKGSDASKQTPGVCSHLRPLVSEQEMQRIREGWTLSNAGDLTIGDLYIMFGEDMKLHLEYDWVWEEATVQRTVAPVDVKLFPLSNDEHTTVPSVVSGNQQLSAGYVSLMSPKAGAEDGASLGSNCCTEMKHESPPAAMNSKDEINVISKRLKQLLILVNMGGKNGKKKCICGNAVERKPKVIQRSDCENNLSTNQEDNLLFKQPMVPARTGINYLTPEPMHMSPLVRYKQSRWWRTRISRHQGHYPSLSIPHKPNVALDTLSAIAHDSISVPTRESTSRAPFPHSNMLTSKGEGSSSSYLPNNILAGSCEPSLSLNRKKQLLYEEENANDIEASGKFALISDNNANCSNQTSSNALSVSEFYATQAIVEEANDGTSDAANRIATTTALHTTTITSEAPIQQNDDSCFSLFDVSLPSTSSSLMANIFSTSTTEADADSGLLQSSPVDTKMFDTELNDISLTSFLGQLDAVYQNNQAAHDAPSQPEKNFDLDISTMSEGSIDYIARFENIASELRAQGNP